MSHVVDFDHAAFVRDWKAFIEKWITKVVRKHGGAASDVDDARQAAFVAAYEGHLHWKSLPEDEQTVTRAKIIISRRVKNAVADEWARLRGVPRNDHQKGGGLRAALLDAGIRQLLTRDGLSYAAVRAQTMSRSFVAYHYMMEGLLHGSEGLERPDTTMLREEVRDRIHFAVDRLQPEAARRLIVGFYFEGRSFKDVGAELGITGRSQLWRMHLDALDQLREEMLEFASALSAKNTGGTLDSGPSGDDA